MEDVLPFFVVILALVGTGGLGLIGWSLSNNVKLGRIVAMIEARQEATERRDDEQDRRLARLENETQP